MLIVDITLQICTTIRMFLNISDIKSYKYVKCVYKYISVFILKYMHDQFLR